MSVVPKAWASQNCLPTAVRAGKRRCAPSRLLELKTLSGLDYSFQAGIRREQIDSLHELGFPERKEKVVVVGPHGASKSGRLVYFETLTDLIDSPRGPARRGPTQPAPQDA